MVLGTTPNVFVISKTGKAVHLARRCLSQAHRITDFGCPLDALAACLNRNSPDLVIAELNNGSEVWIPALQSLTELAMPPRRLLLCEPGMLDEVMYETLRTPEDQLVLWPCTDDEFMASLHYMMQPPPHTMDSLGSPDLRSGL